MFLEDCNLEDILKELVIIERGVKLGKNILKRVVKYVLWEDWNREEIVVVGWYF